MAASLNNYSILKQIGEGGFGEVNLATTNDGREFAIKRILKSRNEEESIKREVAAGKKLEHSNIVRFENHIEDEESDNLIFEYVNGKQTQKKILVLNVNCRNGFVYHT